ncbi:monocarboxylate transporter 12-like [Lytechinus variegatus]|uniref:monocarboxylate transporter 12-like n=1 Tax=Lytechinus variegatus TaxID=7654 RepID=UPI001BB22D10|nr:monocarboxylate transporter 12-like [Lytechinus variegatus]
MSNTRASSWGYVIVFCKFVMLFIDSGIEKSFGVLIPTMVKHLKSDYATIGLICSMPSTLMYILSPLVTLLLRRASSRSIAMSGGLLSGMCFVISAFLKTTVTVGVCLALSGVGLAMTNMPTSIAVNDFFREDFVFWSTVAGYGYTAGAMVLPIVTEKSFQAYGYEGVFMILGGVVLHLLVCGAAIRKVERIDDDNLVNNHDDEENRRRLSSQEGPSEDKKMFRQMDEEYEEEVEEIDEEQEVGICEETCQEERRLIRQGSRPNRNHESFTNESSVISCGLLTERIVLYSIPIPFLLFYTSYAWMLFLVPHAEHLGIYSSNAIYLSAIGGLGGILGRAIFIILIRKGFNENHVYIVVGLICTGSFLLDFISSAYSVRSILAFAQGFSLFIEESVHNSLAKRTVFDEENFNMALATFNFTAGMGIACAGVFTGYLFDVIQSFTIVFIIIGVIHGIGVINLLIVEVLIRRRR